MKFIRAVLGFLILLFDRTFSPSPQVKRTHAEQDQVNSRIAPWMLYQLVACPFCVKVRRHMKRLNISIPMRNIKENQTFQDELLAGGKVDQVPCLKYLNASGQVIWLYESSEINLFLTQEFGK